MEYVVIGCRCLLALVFGVAAASKVRSRAAFGEFLSSVRSLRLLPRPWSRPVTAAVVAGELLTAVSMLAPAALAAVGFGLGATLLVAFAAAIVTANRGGVRVPCRCFGAGGATLGTEHVTRNLLLAAVAVVGGAGLAAGAPPDPHPAAFAIALAAGAVLAVLAIATDDLVALFRATPAQPATGAPNPRRAQR